MKARLFIIGFAAILTACNGESSVKSITVIGEDSANTAALMTVTDRFKNETGIDVRFVTETFDDLQIKTNQDLALGTGQFDIIMQYNFTLSGYVENDLVWSISELAERYPDVSGGFDNDLFPQAWAEVGHYYSDFDDESSKAAAFGYPFAANTLLLVTNDELFKEPANRERYRQLHDKELAVPTDWASFANVAEFFSQTTDTPGVVLQGASGGWLYYEWAAVMASQGLSVYPKVHGWERGIDMSASLNDPAILAATRDYIALKPFNAGGFENVDATVQGEILKRGGAAMAIVWSDFVPGLVARSEIDFQVNPLPGDQSPLAGGSFYINKDSSEPRAAYQLVSWLMLPEQQKQLLMNNLGSPSAAAFTDEILADSQFARAMKTSIERGVYAFEANKDSELVNNTLTVALQRAWIDPENLGEYFSEANQTINRERRRLLSR